MSRRFVLRARRRPGEVSFAGDLNEEQLAVATAPGGPMLVVAGAGTGKTRALTYRLAWLAHAGIDPSRIMLVTFTNRAAREMLHRVSLLVKGKTRNIWGGTFHHIGNRILRMHGRALGLEPDFTILDREDACDLMGSCLAEAKVPVGKRRFPGKSVLVQISSFIQNTLEPLEKVLEKRYPMFGGDAAAIRKVLDLYAARKRARRLLDYDDLLTGWLALMTEREDVRVLLADQFLHVLVDEYQDTNAIQGAIVDLLASKHRNVCVVGDDSQSIYSFRGASFENVLGFRERYPDAKEYRLETNYRSTPEILALANASIAHNVRRLPKTLRAHRPSGVRPAVVPCGDHFVQSEFVAEYILHLLDEGRSLNDVAVLYRAHWHSMEIQLELQRRNIPFQVRGGLRFFEQAHIKDVVAFLRLVRNPYDELAWLRTLSLLPKVGSALSRRLWQHASATPNPIQALCAPEAAGQLPRNARPFFAEFVGLLRDLAPLSSPADMMDLVMKRFYEDYMVSHFENSSLRRQDIRGLMDFAGQYKNAESFLAEVALSGEFSGETVVAGPQEDEFVVLSTIHQAKGLEWPVVIIPWLADGRFPIDFALNTPEDEEEERRIFHVAVTRAKDEVYMVVPRTYHSRTQGVVMMKPSRFLSEIEDDVVERMELEEGLPVIVAGEQAQAKRRPATKRKTPRPRHRAPRKGADGQTNPPDAEG